MNSLYSVLLALERTRPDQNDLRRTRTDQNALERTSFSRTRTDQNGLERDMGNIPIHSSAQDFLRQIYSYCCFQETRLQETHRVREASMDLRTFVFSHEKVLLSTSIYLIYYLPSFPPFCFRFGGSSIDLSYSFYLQGFFQSPSSLLFISSCLCHSSLAFSPSSPSIFYPCASLGIHLLAFMALFDYFATRWICERFADS